jgi:predicted MFS family arabinose efflux permease
MGRVVSTNRIVVLGLTPIGSLLGGALATEIGLRETVVAGAGVAFLGLVPLLASPWRTLRELPAPRAELGEPRQ